MASGERAARTLKSFRVRRFIREDVMSKISLSRRRVLLASGAVGLVAALRAQSAAAAEESTIRLFRVNVPEEQLVDLRRRIAATRWPDKETVADASQGVPLAKL